MIDEVIHQKTRLLILNKMDMADEAETKKWIAYFEEKGIQQSRLIHLKEKDSKLFLKLLKSF